MSYLLIDIKIILWDLAVTLYTLFLIEKELNTKTLKTMSQLQNLNLKACLLSISARG